MASYVFMADGSQKPFDGLEVGDVLEGGGVVESLEHVFKVSNNAIHLFRQVSLYDPHNFQHETIQLSRHPRVVVYMENLYDQPYFQPFMTYDGNTHLGLVAAIHQRLDELAGISHAEYFPDIQVYNKRQGVTGRQRISAVLPTGCEVVYVLLW
jgi:hypothetical protein